MNTPTEIRIENPQFLKKAPNVYHCFLVLGRSYMSYALMDEAHATVFAVYHFDFQHQVIGKNDFDRIFSEKHIQKAAKYYLAINTQKQTIVPSSLYVSKEKELYTEHLFELTDEETLFEKSLGEDYTSLFALKNNSVNYFKSRLSNLELFDVSASVLKAYPSNFSSKHSTHLFIHTLAEATVISLYENQELKFHKRYSQANENDVLYYTLNTLQQFGLQPADTHVKLHGESAVCDNVFELFDGRFGEVNFCSRLHEFAFPEDLYQHPSHYFFNLFSLVLCV